MSATGRYLQAQDLQTIIVTRYAVAANGTLSSQSQISLYAYFRRVGGQLTQETVDVRPSHQVQRNMMPTNYGDSWEVAVLQASGDEDELQTLIRNGLGSGFRYKIAYTESGRGKDSWVTFEGLDYGNGEEGENLLIARFGPCAVTGEAQTTIV